MVEKIMFDSLLKLVSQVGYSDAFVFTKNKDSWTLSFKKGNKKITRKYEKLYDLCLGAFELMDNLSSKYCLNRFEQMFINNIVEDKMKIMELINKSARKSFLNRKVGEIRHDNICYGGEIVDFTEYDDCSVGDFLILYKIDKLMNMGIISSKEGALLEELYYLKLSLLDKIAELTAQDISRSDNFITLKKSHLHQKIDEIDRELGKSNLTEFNVDLNQMMNIAIEHEKYKKQDVKRLMRVIKSMDECND